MKYYTPALVSAKKKRGIWSLFLGQASEQRHYRAKHRTDDITAMWLEASQFGKVNSFPCVLREGQEYMVFFTTKSPGTAKENAAFIQRWNLFLTPANINTEWDVEEMNKKDFYGLFHEIQHKVINDQFGEPQPEGEKQLEACTCGCEHEHEHEEACTCGCEHEHEHEEACACGCEHEHELEEACACGCEHEHEHEEACTCGCEHENEQTEAETKN